MERNFYVIVTREITRVSHFPRNLGKCAHAQTVDTRRSLLAPPRTPGYEANLPYEYTSQALAGGERIYGCKERPFILHQGFDSRALQAGHFTHVELAVFFSGSTKCKFIATVRTCIWQQIRVSKRLVPASPFTCYIFHGFATPFSGCIIIFLKDFLLAQLSLRLHGLSTRLCSRRKSAVRA